MKIMVDTNVLLSAILFPNSNMNELFSIIIQKHRLVLASFVIDELIAVVKRKFRDKGKAVDRFLQKFPYETAYTPKEMIRGIFEIRDKNDYPVLYTAIVEDVDILITGDKDFLDINIKKPEILSPRLFLEKFGKYQA